MRYEPHDSSTVADIIEHQLGEWKYTANDDLETIIANANLIFDVAFYEGEIAHPTEYLDIVHADRCAAMFVLARRDKYGYSVDRKRSGDFDRDFIDNLKMRVPIQSLVEATGARLIRRGRGWLARCPFPDHDDRSPSFQTYDETNSFYCFGCLRGGDAYDFLMLTEGIDFPESVRRVADRAGVEIPSRWVLKRGGVNA